MVIEGWAMGELTGETVAAMHGVGRKVVGAIHGHEELIAKDPKMRQHAVLCKARKDRHKHWIEVTRHERIEQMADLIVTGNPLHAQQGVDIIVPLGVLQPALILQKRRRLGEEDAKGASGGILDAVAGVWPLWAMVGQLIDPLL